MLKINDGSVFVKLLAKNLQKILEELQKPKSSENCSFSSKKYDETTCTKLKEHIKRVVDKLNYNSDKELLKALESVTKNK